MTLGISHMDSRKENRNVPIVPNEIAGTQSINGNVSGITEELGLPKMPTRSLTATEIGLSPTPDHNFFINEKLNDEGYDSNGDLGPTRNAPGMEEDINIDEEDVAQIPVVNENIENHGENIPLTNAMIEKIKVSELKVALESRNI